MALILQTFPKEMKCLSWKGDLSESALIMIIFDREVSIWFTQLILIIIVQMVIYHATGLWAGHKPVTVRRFPSDPRN